MTHRRRRWDPSTRWAEAAGQVSPSWDFLDAEPYRATRTPTRRFARVAGYPSRAAGAAQSYEAVRATICSVPLWPELSSVGRAVLNAGSLKQLTFWVHDGYSEIRGWSGGVLPAVSRGNIASVFNAMDGFFAVCAPRAGGMRGDALRVLATSIEVVGSPAAAVPLYTVATAVGASGLLIEVVGVAVTGWIGVGMAAVVGMCEVLLALGLPTELRKIADEFDAEDSATATPTGPTPAQIQQAIDLGIALPMPTRPGSVPVPDTTAGVGGGGALALLGGAGVLGLGFLFLR